MRNKTYIPIYKSIFLIIIILYSSHITLSQTSIGVQVGVSQNWIQASNPLKSIETKPSFGFSGMIALSKRINKHTSIWIIPGFIEKNYSETGIGNYKNIITKYKNLYFQTSLLTSLEFAIRSFYPHIKGGFYMSYWLHSKNSGLIPDIFSTTATVQPDGTISETIRLVNFSNTRKFLSTDRRMEIGIALAGGVGYKLNKIYKIILGYDFLYSFTSTSKNNNQNKSRKTNLTSTLSLGLMYEIKRKA